MPYSIQTNKQKHKNPHQPCSTPFKCPYRVESSGGWRNNNDQKGDDWLSLRESPVVRYLLIEVKDNK